MKRLFLAAVLFAPGLALAAPAPTVTTPPAATTPSPDPAANPVLANLQKSGARIFAMGNRMGLDGWFIVKDGQVQIAYATPDNKGILVGGLFGQDGENITTLQVGSLIQTNKDVADLIAAAQKEQAGIAAVGSPPAATPPLGASAAGVPSVPLSPGERLIHELGSASTVVVGNAAAPEILMVMDPHCLHCQATWKALRDTVFKGTVHLRMVPIGDASTDNERAAAFFLGVADPLNTWDKYVAGDKSQLAGAPTQAALDAVRANHALTDRWSIRDTPYLVYRGRDGKVKVVQGEPEKITTLLTDLAPTTAPAQP